MSDIVQQNEQKTTPTATPIETPIETASVTLHHFVYKGLDGVTGPRIQIIVNGLGGFTFVVDALLGMPAEDRRKYVEHNMTRVLSRYATDALVDRYTNAVLALLPPAPEPDYPVMPEE